jgi:hypothetical protein
MQQKCDICSRSEVEFFSSASDEIVLLEPPATDGDGLRICGNCRAQLVTAPVLPREPLDAADEIRPLVGKGAGAICMTLNLPYHPPFRSIIDAASEIQDSLMSAWTFVTQRSDATTVWRAPDGSAIAVVGSDGSIRVEKN